MRAMHHRLQKLPGGFPTHFLADLLFPLTPALPAKTHSNRANGVDMATTWENVSPKISTTTIYPKRRTRTICFAPLCFAMRASCSKKHSSQLFELQAQKQLIIGISKSSPPRQAKGPRQSCCLWPQQPCLHTLCRQASQMCNFPTMCRIGDSFAALHSSFPRCPDSSLLRFAFMPSSIWVFWHDGRGPKARWHFGLLCYCPRHRLR